MNLSVKDAGGGALVISQFTLYGSVQRGFRPSFDAAAAPEKAEKLYKSFIQHLEDQLGTPVQTGAFGAMMDVHLLNDGPVSLWIERLSDLHPAKDE